MKYTKIYKTLIVLAFLAAVGYGIGRLYFAMTAGFLMSNIRSDLPYDSRWETHQLTEEEQKEINFALNQDYRYLGKGCQSYVFASVDGNYVIKFFKFQRFRPQAWINLLTFIPFVENYQENKIIEKQQNLEKLFTSCTIAFDILRDETGVIYIHLNKTKNWNKTISIEDKLGITHQIDIDEIAFVLQKRAFMFEETIDHLMADGSQKKAKELIDELLVMLLSEYFRGYADNDHALMQNTGVLSDKPIHIDFGQFIYNPIVQNPEIYQVEMFNKTTQLKEWLTKNYPDLANHLRYRLVSFIGPDYYFIIPYVHKGNVGKIPHVPNKI